MRNELEKKELKEHEERLVDEIKKLDRLIKYGEAEKKKRTEKIWIDCKSRIDKTETIKHFMKEVHEKLIRIEKMLG